MAHSEPDDIISWQDAVKLAGCSDNTLRKALAAQGDDKLHIVRLSPRRIGVRRSEWRRWTTRGERRGAA
jgi:hypothetical protein